MLSQTDARTHPPRVNPSRPARHEFWIRHTGSIYMPMRGATPVHPRGSTHLTDAIEWMRTMFHVEVVHPKRGPWRWMGTRDTM